MRVLNLAKSLFRAMPEPFKILSSHPEVFSFLALLNLLSATKCHLYHFVLVNQSLCKPIQVPCVFEHSFLVLR